MSKGPLEGIRVLEAAFHIVGPLAGAILGDLGAEVIKIEDPVNGDPNRGIIGSSGIPAQLPGGRNYFFELPNRNAKSVTIDITTEAGREILYRLVRECDVFIQNFRPGVVERLKLDYPTISEINPKIIYASASGYGKRGPDATQPGIDMMGLARGGWMTHCGEQHQPPQFPGNPIADQTTAQSLAFGVVTALLARERLGVAQEVETSLLGSVMGIQSVSIGASLLIGRDLSRPVRKKARNPLWSYYRCADDRWVALGMSHSDRYWTPFCRAIGRADLTDDPKFSTLQDRAKNCQELVAILDDVFATRPMAEWLKHFREQGDFLIQPVQYHHELANDPQVIANEYIQDFDHPVLGKIKVVGSPVRYSKTPAAMRAGAPEFGEHTEEVLQQIAGLSLDEITALRKQKVI